MYETEANNRIEQLNQIPPDVQTQLRSFDGKILGRTLLPWGEHCTECVWPTCYTTCDLYSPREDLRCRRFLDGMVRIDCPGSLNSYLVKIRFKRWGKLWAPGNVQLSSVEEAQREERRDYRLGSLIYRLPLPAAAKKLVSGRRYKFKTDRSQRRRPSAQLPTSFLLECYNPGNETVQLCLTLRPLAEGAKIPFQALVDVNPGFLRLRVPVDDISRQIDLHMPFEAELIPNDVADGTTLYFGIMDFVSEQRQSVAKGKTTKNKAVKCVVWDLDNTLWEGTLVEDGAQGLRPKAGVLQLIEELDRRGILNSVASKNSFDDTWPVLKQFGVDEFVVAPQISWGPKSDSMLAIAQQLNIGLDSLLFVDDSTFELEQVRSACPDVRVLDASDVASILHQPECQGSITEEGANRRKMYQEEGLRQKVAETFSQNYLSFLRHCNLLMTIKPLDRMNLTRVHELTQRTNQMNFSGTRYDRGVLESLLANPHFDTYVIECRDRFGSYGVIGFSVVDRRQPRMTDLMFSCRIQSKRVEHAFLSYVIRRYVSETSRDFWADYRKTPRNAPSGRVFADLGMEEVEGRDGVTCLVFRKDRQVPDDGIVTIATPPAQ